MGGQFHGFAVDFGADQTQTKKPPYAPPQALSVIQEPVATNARLVGGRQKAVNVMFEL